ncbi:hypothetical protein LPJ62_006719 [Coemansia sp. RSA 2167]|nr:hypothetical protein LPJ69_005105 [Coemansia sp. RSA 1752]KAJ1757924.1 hypothetical protein LPJ58_003057 [Coemansia sp. RSA 1591]KAJ1776418.1 hypothetical protein LPJ62_006719 [Coemansia sp. RSA 2167]KAJ1782624.1 hypothetical protein LPJ67_005025 [Coemansia sp. RSA 1938]KAJ2131390.1 hypothetical protein GGF48_001564 [Coemansia sp. RSA 921]KAJ2141300.1 hypothetical protein IW142_004935 [Coemansia sp. RSA 564]KAJ2152667.1 hypothetical protein J3F82_002524 [Coemansia sp. RSA 637]KAJ2181700.1
MFSLAKIATAVSAVWARPLGSDFGQLSVRAYSRKGKTGALKCKEKSKRRRLRIAKPDAPAQSKRGVRVSKL